MKIEVKRKLFWYYRLVGDNGKVLMTSETYYSKANAYRAARDMQSQLNTSIIKGSVHVK